MKVRPAWASRAVTNSAPRAVAGVQKPPATSESSRVVAASASLGDAPAVTARRGGADGAVPIDLDGVPDDDETEDYRAWLVTRPGPDGPVTAVVGTSRESVREDVLALGVALLVAMPLVLLASAALLWLLLGRTLRPVEEAHRRQRTFVADAEPVREELQQAHAKAIVSKPEQILELALHGMAVNA